MELTFFVPSAGTMQRVKEVHFEKLWRPEAAFNFLTMTNWNIEGIMGFYLGMSLVVMMNAGNLLPVKKK